MRALIDKRGNKYMVRNGEFHSDLGFIKKADIERSKVGDILLTHLGGEFRVIMPNVNDYIELMERKCSIILPKDIGVVVAHTGVGCGDRVVDAGSGAGAAAIYFGNVVGDRGEVYSYEVREEFAKIARRNIAGFGLENVHVKCQDITEGIDEGDVDLVFLDLPKPWKVVEHAEDALRVGGYLVAYNPYIEQVKILHKVLKKSSFSELNTLECILREIEVKNKGTRPKTRMVGHTGYLTFARLL